MIHYVCCTRCVDQVRGQVVGCLSDETGRWRLAPVASWWPGLPATDFFCYPEDWGSAVGRDPVELYCPRCKRSCGSWRAATLAARLPDANECFDDERVALLVPDGPGGRRWVEFFGAGPVPYVG